MPLFMIVSGYFANSVLKYSIKDLLIKKIGQLILPAIPFGLLFCIIYKFLFNNSWGGVIHCFISCYWFLKCLFVCFLLYKITSWIGNISKHNISLILIGMVISQFIPFYTIDRMYPCFCVGIFISNRPNILKSNLAIISGLLLILYSIFFIFWINNNYTIGNINILNARSLDKYFICLYHRGMTILGGTFVFFLFIFLGGLLNLNRIGDILGKIGKYTLSIYLIQGILLELIMRKYLNLSKYGCWTFNLIISPILAIIILLFCYYISLKINNSPMFRMLLLGKIQYR